MAGMYQTTINAHDHRSMTTLPPDVKPIVDAYVKEVEKGQALIKKLGGSAVLRVWRARFAGNEAGTVVVSVEYPDLVTYANDDKKLNVAPEYQTWMKGLAKIRKITSDSLYEELKP